MKQELKTKLESDCEFLSVIRNLSQKTRSSKKIHELINMEDLIHEINIDRIFMKKKPFVTISDCLLKNKFVNEDDLTYLFEVINNQFEVATLEYRGKLKKSINSICAESIKRGFENLRVMIFAKHEGIQNCKAVSDLINII